MKDRHAMQWVIDRFGIVVRTIVQRPWLVIVSALLLSVVGVHFARQLRVETDFSHLLPPDTPSVRALEELRETVGSEAAVDMVIQSPSFAANKAFAEALIPRALELAPSPQAEPYLNRVDFEKDTEFLERNALYFATEAELDSLESYLRGRIRDAKLDANPFFFDLELEEEEEAEGAYDIGQDLQEVYDGVIGKRYPVNEDSTIMVVRFYPSGSQTDIGFIEALYADLERLVDTLGPAAYQPEMKVIPAGRLLRQLVEVQAITNDVRNSFAAGATAVLLLVLVYFSYKGYAARASHRFSGRMLLEQLARTPILAVVIGLPLSMSLSWTFGMARLVFGSLNLMTSTLGLVLFGLGIDYGIHFYARYTEERRWGQAVAKATETTFRSTGRAIAIGALTTAAALYVLVVADFRGFSEFGFMAGTGILFALLAMTVVMPALLVVFERYRLLDFDSASGETSRDKHGSGIIPGARAIVLVSVGAVVAALVLLPRVDFQYDFGALEPRYEEYDSRRGLVSEVYPARWGNPAYVLVGDSSGVRMVREAVTHHADQDTLSPTIGRVETLQDRFPISESDRRSKLDRIATIRELLRDPLVQADAGEDLERIERAAGTTVPISIDQLPEGLRNQFTTKAGELGGFVMIYPSVELSDGRWSMAFAEDVGTIMTEDGRTWHAGSTSLVAADMLRLMLREAPWMVVITFVMVMILMWVHFGSRRLAALAMAPLVVGVLWMMLVMGVSGLSLNFYNLVVLPAVLGIGNDAGVHLVHRYREEGRRSIRHVLRYTGEHITMGSLTTMIGFSGLLLSFHPGLRSIGELAVAGIGTTLLAALVFLPGMLQWLERRSGGAQEQRLGGG